MVGIPGEGRITDYPQCLKDWRENMLKVNIGDIVVMNSKYWVSDKNKGKEFTVKSEPWNLCGTMVVKLEGYSGGYALDGLTIVEGK